MTSQPIFHTEGLAADPSGRERWWAPSDPRIFVPRAIGIGWDINFGAVAVKLGLLREDDIDDDVVAAIPPEVSRNAQAALALSAGVALAISLASAARTSKPAAAVSNAIGIAAVTGFAATRQQPGDKLITGSLATGINTAIGVGALKPFMPNATWRTAIDVAQPFALFGLPLGIVTRAIKSGLENVVAHSGEK